MLLGKGNKGWSRGRRAVAAGLIVGLSGMAGACNGSPTETTRQNPTAAVSEADLSAGLGDLTEGLGLTDDQVEAVGEVMGEYRGRVGEPGTLWYVAADLQKVFTADQIAAIEARVAERRAEMNPRPDEMTSRGLRGQDARGGLADLDLSEEQRVRLREIRESYRPQMEEIRDALRDGSLTREDAGVRLEAIRDAIHQAVLEVLTPDQRAVMEKRRAEAEVRREEAKAQREARRQAEHSAMVESLGLTPEQVTAIEALEGWPVGEGRPSRDEMRARRDEHHQALLGILDDDQEQIWVLHRSVSVSLSRGPAHVGSGAGHRGRGRHGGQAAGGNGFRGPASRT